MVTKQPTREYAVTAMRSRSHRFTLAIVLVLVAGATTVTLVHWHPSGIGQGCDLCHVRQLPSVYTPLLNPFIGLVIQDWVVKPADIRLETSECMPLCFGRAPPQSLSV